MTSRRRVRSLRATPELWQSAEAQIVAGWRWAVVAPDAAAADLVDRVVLIEPQALDY